MRKNGIEVKRKTDIGLVLETPFWLDLLQRLYPKSLRISYDHSQDEVLHINLGGLDIACIADRGASMSACITERLRVYGAKAIVRVGTCGGLSANLKLFHPVISTACFSDEGTSKHYLPAGFPIISDAGLNAALATSFKKNNLPFQFGITVTTDGRWRENPALLRELAQLGVLTIEMDTAAIFSVCQFRKIPVAAVNIPVDLPAHEKGEDDLKGVPTRRDHRQKLEAAFSIILPLVLGALVDYYKQNIKK